MQTFPLWPPLLALAALLYAACALRPVTSLPSPYPRASTGPLWADGEIVTIARTGERVVWRVGR